MSEGGPSSATGPGFSIEKPTRLLEGDELQRKVTCEVGRGSWKDDDMDHEKEQSKINLFSKVVLY